MILLELVEWLEEQGIGKVGTNIFIGEFPKSVEDAIIVMSVPSTEPDKYTGVEYQTIEIWSRYKNDQAGWEKLNQVYSFLHRNYVLYLPNYQVYNISALSRIEDFDRDIEQRKMWKLSFELTYRNLDLIS